MKYAVKLTRRQFMKLSAFTMALCASGLNFARDAYAKAKDYIGERIGSVYARDARMRYRKSQDNPMIRKIYSEFLHEPLGHTSESLLHTEYEDRSAKVRALKERGIKLAL